MIRFPYLFIFALCALALAGVAHASAPLLALAGVAHASAPLPAFTAHYAVSKDGKRIGKATLQLAPAGNAWVYTTKVRGTSGLASLLNVTLDETSRFRWRGESPVLVSYDYDLDSMLRRRQRHVRTADGHVHVIAGKREFRYPAVAGMVERHSTVLAIAAQLRAGATRITLPVATRERIEEQHFAVTGHHSVQVPAGTFEATRVARTDHGDGIRAWYAAACVVPVKLAQDDSGLTLSLLSCSAPTPIPATEP